MKSRKLWAFILMELFSIGLLLKGVMTADQWIDFTKWIFGLYAAGNVGEHFSEKLK